MTTEDDQAKDTDAIATEFCEARDAMAPLQARMDAGEHGAEFITQYVDAAIRYIDAAFAFEAASRGQTTPRRHQEQ